MKIELSIPGYEIKRELGRGGMAVVYLAIQQSFGRDVALKVLPLINASDESFTERFLREAKIVSRLVHPNIVTVYDVGIHQDHHYLSMEYIPGMDLRQAQAKLPRLELINAIKSVARALDFAGKKGYVHRDVKPENIMLHSEDNRVILMDFGIARGSDTALGMTATGRAIGTPYYMSPEQTKGRTVDHRSDIYSLGIVLYQMLTGRVPYDADSAVAVGIKHITEPIPVLPQNLRIYQTLINTALAKSPEHRYQSAGEFITELEAIPEDALKMLEDEAESYRSTGLNHNASTLASNDEAVLNSLPSGLLDSVATPSPFNQINSQQTAVTRISSTRLLQAKKRRKSRSSLVYILLAVVVSVGLYQRENIVRVYEAEKSRLSILLGKNNSKPAQVNVPPKKNETNTPSTRQEQLTSARNQPEPQKLSKDEIENSIKQLKQTLDDNPLNATKLATLYKQTLRQKPNDDAARRGIKELRDWYSGQFKAALAINDLQTARQRMNMLKDSFPRMSRSPRYVAFEKRLKKEETFIIHLEQAKKYIAFKQFARPADANALTELIAANKIHPGYEEIVNLRKEVADFSYIQATEYLKLGHKEKAQFSIQTGLKASPGHKELLSLTNNVDIKIPVSRKVSPMLARANTYFNDEQYFNPAGKNAYDAYRTVLKHEPANQQAKQGLDKIKRLWLNFFYANLKQGDLNDAASSLAKIQERYAGDPAIQKAQNKLARALANLQPEISTVRVSSHKLYSLRTPEPKSIQTNKPVYLGFRYVNFAEVAETLYVDFTRQFDQLSSQQQEINVSGDSGDKFLTLDLENHWLTPGKYMLEIKLGEKTLSRKTIIVN